MEADAIKEAMSKMAERAQRLTMTAAKWRGYLLETMDCIGSTSIKDARIVVTVKTNPPSVQIDDDGLIPLSYCRMIPERIEVDKTKIKSALKAGESIPGVSLASTRRLAIQ